MVLRAPGCVVTTAPARIDLRGVGADDWTAPAGGLLAPAVRHLAAGGVVACPTETVYGFSGPTTREGVARVLALKARAENRPVLLLVDTPDDAPGLSWTADARELAEVFWPGALTLVLADPEGRYPPGVRSATGGVAVRRTAHPLAAALVRALGAPITSTSANAPGEAPARSGDEAAEVVTRLGAAEQVLVLDVGRLDESAPSTVVDCTGQRPRVLREGAIPIGRLRCVLPEVGS